MIGTGFSYGMNASLAHRNPRTLMVLVLVGVFSGSILGAVVKAYSLPE